MDQKFRYFELCAPTGQLPLGLDAALAAVRDVFAELETDVEAGLAVFRVKQQQLASLGAPPPILACYDDMRAVRVRIGSGLPDGYCVEFDLWEFGAADPAPSDGSEAANRTRALVLRPRPDETHFEACRVVAEQVAGALGYTLAVAEGHEPDCA